MTISATEPLLAGPYNGNGVTTVFSYAMTIFSEAEVLVFLRDSNGVETLQTLNVDYTVTPTGGAFPATGGIITMLVAPPTGVELIILPDITRSQDRPFSSQSSITLQEVEDALDKITAITRQLYERSLRAVTVSAFDPGDVDTLLANVTALVALESEIVTLTANLSTLQAVEADLASINLVASNMANVVALAAIDAAISTVAANIASVNTVATDIANVNIVAAAVAALNTVATAIANVNTVAGSIASVNTVAGQIAAVQNVSDNIGVIAGVDPSLYTKVNSIINGDFRFWQRGTSSGAVGYVACDRWANFFLNGTSTQSRVTNSSFTKFGRANIEFFMQMAVAGGGAAGSYSILRHQIEDVQSHQGETVTVLGWARRTSGAGDLYLEMEQTFGTGGSPSAPVQIPGGVITLTADWEPFAVVINVPSVVGKTLGTTGDDNVAMNFWASSGSTFSARAGGMGQQTLTYQMAGVHILPGTHDAGMTANYNVPHISERFSACQRYYEEGGGFMQAPVAGTVGWMTQYGVTKRRAPTVSLNTTSTVSFGSLTAQGITSRAIGANGVASASGGYAFFDWTADAEFSM